MQNCRIKSSGDLLDVEFELFWLLGRRILAILAPREAFGDPWEANPAPREALRPFGGVVSDDPICADSTYFRLFIFGVGGMGAAPTFRRILKDAAECKGCAADPKH